MSQVSCKKNEPLTMTPNRGVRRRLATLASVESLAIPLVQEVVFLADYRCSKCQQRVADIMNKMNGETQSVVINVKEKKVTLTYTNCLQYYGYPNSWSILRLFRSSCS